MDTSAVTLFPSESVVTMRSRHRQALLNLIEQAAAISQAAALITDKANETLHRGGAVSVQQQLNFITGAHARLVKDWGLIEYLQQQGVRQRGTPR